jgi:protein O-GlcNAc transferase
VTSDGKEENTNDLDNAYKLLLAGNLTEAKKIYLETLAAEPDNYTALHYLGIIENNTGDKENAIRLISGALELKPDWAEAHYNLGNVFFDTGQLQKALNSYQKAVSIRENYPEALYNAGLIIFKEGRLAEAENYFSRTIDFKKDWDQPFYYLGLARMEQGNIAGAEVSFREATRINPLFADAFYNLGNTLFDQGKLEETELCYNTAVQLKPDWTEVYYNLGLVRQTLGKPDEAADNYRQALSLYPDFIEALYRLGIVLSRQLKYDEAEMCLRRVIETDPQWTDVYIDLGNVLLEKGEAGPALDFLYHALKYLPDRADLIYSIGNAMLMKVNLQEAISFYKNAIALKPDFFLAYDNLFLTLQYMSGLTPEQWRRETEPYTHLSSSLSGYSHYKNEKNPAKKLRIGYVSPDFRFHSCCWFIEPLFAAHNPQEVEIICFSEVAKPDFITRKLVDYSNTWYNTVGMSDNQMTELIQSAGIDILVDLAGHTANNRLTVFARKPAPVQVSWLGFPATTGLTALDYRISDSWLTPPDSAEFFTEKLLILERPAYTYQPPEGCPEVNNLPALKNNFITFGSFNNFAKISAETIKLWSEVLLAVPGSQLLLKANRKADDHGLWQKLTDSFSSYGIEKERIRFLSKEADINLHLKYYHEVDIALDTFPYNGATTTLEALWMGVPVLSLAGDRAASRYGLAFLTAAGLPELAAATSGNFVKTAVNLAADREKLINLRKGLRGQAAGSPLYDHQGFAREIEKTFRQIWQQWCNQ